MAYGTSSDQLAGVPRQLRAPEGHPPPSRQHCPLSGSSLVGAPPLVQNGASTEAGGIDVLPVGRSMLHTCGSTRGSQAVTSDQHHQTSVVAGAQAGSAVQSGSTQSVSSSPSLSTSSLQTSSGIGHAGVPMQSESLQSIQPSKSSSSPSSHTVSVVGRSHTPLFNSS